MIRSVAILGATGLVGRTMLGCLEERAFPCDTVRLLASDRSGARALPFRGGAVPVVPADDHAFDGIDIALFAVPNDLAQRWAKVARAAGAQVIDNSSAFRYVDAVPLVVPEINGALLDAHPMLIANPNCSTIGVAMTLAPLTHVARLERLSVATYQSVSGAGSEAVEALDEGVRAGLDGPPPPRPGGRAPFAFNVIPQIDRFEENGYTREEMKVVWETRKILALPDLPVTCTAVRVPVRVGHCAAIEAVFDPGIGPAEARRLWSAFPGVRVVDDPGSQRYPTPLEAAGGDEVLVGRARHDLTHPRGLVYFCASDNLRKGAALNAVQIAECLVRIGAGRR